MSATAIIQARMGSSRLPGKVLMEVAGKPLLAYLVERVRMAKRIGKIIIATSSLSQDNPIAEFCKKRELDCFRGSEEDVLDRYYQAAKYAEARHVVRLTGDCPLLDPVVCDRCVDEYFFNNIDYVCTDQSFAEGLDCEVFSFNALEESWKYASLFSEREHVTQFIRKNGNFFKLRYISNEVDDSWIRVTVDCKEDFEVIENIILNSVSDEINIDHIRNYLQGKPKIVAINSCIQRNEGLIKSVKNDTVAKRVNSG
jgi:spore coat polysaccharide biosynthesis protein SpsF (cytidylyltransferase family)